MGLSQGLLRRRSREVLVIGEEQLLDEVDTGLLGQQADIGAAHSVAVAPSQFEGKPEAVAAGDAEANGRPGEVHEEHNGRAAPEDRNEEELEAWWAAARGAATKVALSRPSPRASALVASVAVVGLFAAVVAIAPDTGGPGSVAPSGGRKHAQPEAPGKHPTPEDESRVDRPERAVTEPEGDHGTAQRGSSSSEVVPAVTVGERPPAAAAPAETPTGTPEAAPAQTPARDASPAVVQQEFGP